MKTEESERRQLQQRLLPMGRYSKAYVIPRWWLRLNGDPEIVVVDLALGSIHIEPTKGRKLEKEGVGDEQR